MVPRLAARARSDQAWRRTAQAFSISKSLIGDAEQNSPSARFYTLPGEMDLASFVASAGRFCPRDIGLLSQAEGIAESRVEAVLFAQLAGGLARRERDQRQEAGRR